MAHVMFKETNAVNYGKKTEKTNAFSYNLMSCMAMRV